MKSNMQVHITKAISMGIRCLIVHGDSKLVINQVRDKITTRHHYLKTYRNKVWYLLESLFIFNMISILRKYNQIIDSLTRKGERLDPTHRKRGAYGVKFLCKPYVPNTTNF